MPGRDCGVAGAEGGRREQEARLRGAVEGQGVRAGRVPGRDLGYRRASVLGSLPQA